MLSSSLRLKPVTTSLLALALAAGLSVTASAPAVADRTTQTPTWQANPGSRPHDHGHRTTLAMKDRPPLSSSKEELRRNYDDTSAKTAAPAAACNVSDFTSKTGAALVTQIKVSTTACINTLFSLTGSDAYHAFREAQMVTVAYGLRDNGSSYPGNNSTSTAQLVLYLRAGYYVHWYNESVVGPYGPALETAIRSGLDSLFANPRAFEVSDANGETLAEAITLIDSAEQNARYLTVVKRMLNGYNSSYNGFWRMLSAVNNVYTVLFRGHQVPAFVAAVQADPSVLDTVHNFASTHIGLLGTEQSYLTSNAGRELGRFLQHGALHAKVRPQARGLLTQSSIRGVTAPLWVGVAEMTDYYDRANCAYFDTCNLQARLAAEILPINHTCASTLRIRAQQMTSSELTWACTSMLNQDAYFHGQVNDPGPVANDLNTDLEVVVFNSSTDYETYAGAMFGIDTNNGGIYLEGNPADPNNQARFIAYEAEWLRPTFEIWNLNHEYTHYLDGRFDMYGDFGANITTPTIWWIEGFAEYVSYSYRNLTYTAAITEAGKRTYALSTLFDTTYSHDATRVYRWGYLAVRYMMQSHRADTTTVLGYYRTGNWNAARTYLRTTIGSRYDADWYNWLAQCAAGNCGGGTTNQPPIASFTYTTSGLTASFTDRSTDPDGTIATRSWTFGDGTTSTATNPVKTYATAGTYTVRLTVTDNRGASAASTQTVTVSGGGTTLPECTGSDPRALGKNCQRSNRSATGGGYDYLYLYLPAGTTQLRITVSGGSGNCDLYYHPSSWATTANYTRRSVTSTNNETLTITNPPGGYHYISLYGVSACGGVTVKTQY